MVCFPETRGNSAQLTFNAEYFLPFFTVFFRSFDSGYISNPGTINSENCSDEYLSVDKSSISINTCSRCHGVLVEMPMST